jgi:CheY-like chemotaxis protein
MKELSDCTVLVVDDTEANVDILVDALGEIYDVSVAMDGREAADWGN